MNPWDEKAGDPNSTPTNPIQTQFKEADDQVVQVTPETITAIGKARSFMSITGQAVQDLQKLGIINDVMGVEKIQNGMVLVSTTAALTMITRIEALSNREGMTAKEQFNAAMKAAHPMGYLMNAMSKLIAANKAKGLPAPPPAPVKQARNVLNTDPIELPIAKLPD